jgi:hypothetical protein
MSLGERLSRAFSAFAAPTVLQRPPSAPPGPTGRRTRDEVRRRRRGERISPIGVKQTRWLRKDIEDAEDEANAGNVRHLAQIGAWVRGDLTVGGLLSTRCSVPRLPRIWRGNEQGRQWLEGEGKTPGLFDTIFPPTELEELAIDHLVDGFGHAVFVRPPRSKWPMLVRLDPQWSSYRVAENRWVYQGYNKLYSIEPGGGTWVTHSNGHIDPWGRGIWADLGRDQCSEDAAGMHRDAFIMKYGNPFVIATSPQGQAEHQKIPFWRSVMQWTMGFAGVTPGHKVDLLQPRAEGREVFVDAESKVERRAMMRICGQIVTSLGGPGFANAEIFAQIVSHLVARTAQDLARTLNEQGIPQIIQLGCEEGWIEDDSPLLLGYDTTPPQARKAEAEAIESAMKAFIAQWDAAEKAGDPRLRPDPEEYRARFRLPVASEGGVALAAAHAAIRSLTAEERRALLDGLRAQNVNGGALESGGISEPDELDVDHAVRLAAEMTEHRMETCEHGFGRCYRCGVERDRGVQVGPDGAKGWRVAWRPLRRRAA